MISTHELKDYMPHRPPMVWIDQVDIVDDQPLTGAGDIFIKPDQLYLNQKGLLRGSSAIEWVAQAYGFTQAYYYKKQNIYLDSLSVKTYLVEINKFKIHFTQVEPVEKLQVQVKRVRELSNLSIIHGRVIVPSSEKLLAEGRVKIFSSYERNPLKFV